MVKETELEKLKRQFAEAGKYNHSKLSPSGIPTPRPQCAYFDDIGQLAMQGDIDALRFLAENLNHEDVFVRYAAVGYLGDMPDEYLDKAGINALEQIAKLMKTEKDAHIMEYAHHAVKRLKKDNDKIIPSRFLKYV